MRIGNVAIEPMRIAARRSVDTDMTTLEKLERLHNYPTRYELIAEKGDARILIGYTMHQSRHGLLSLCRQNGEKLVSFMGLDDKAEIVFLKPAKLGATMGGWSVKFSGRTQRDAISNGELAFIGNLVNIAA